MLCRHDLESSIGVKISVFGPPRQLPLHPLLGISPSILPRQFPLRPLLGIFLSVPSGYFTLRPITDRCSPVPQKVALPPSSQVASFPSPLRQFHLRPFKKDPLPIPPRYLLRCPLSGSFLSVPPGQVPPRPHYVLFISLQPSKGSPPYILPRQLPIHPLPAPFTPIAGSNLYHKASPISLTGSLTSIPLKYIFRHQSGRWVAAPPIQSPFSLGSSLSITLFSPRKPIRYSIAVHSDIFLFQPSPVQAFSSLPQSRLFTR